MELSKPRHVVISIPGTRTTGPWMRLLDEELRSLPAEEGVLHAPFDYGFFDFLRFFIPLYFRSIVVQKFYAFYRSLRQQYGNEVPISVCAHSFGSYVVGQIIDDSERFPDIRFHRVLMYGSLINPEFQWPADGRIGLIVNDVGNVDYWPLLGALFVWGMRASGRVGFRGTLPTLVVNRFHDGMNHIRVLPAEGVHPPLVDFSASRRASVPSGHAEPRGGQCRHPGHGEISAYADAIGPSRRDGALASAGRARASRPLWRRHR
jgi:hypothetical protein